MLHLGTSREISLKFYHNLQIIVHINVQLPPALLLLLWTPALSNMGIQARAFSRNRRIGGDWTDEVIEIWKSDE